MAIRSKYSQKLVNNGFTDLTNAAGSSSNDCEDVSELVIEGGF